MTSLISAVVPFGYSRNISYLQMKRFLILFQFDQPLLHSRYSLQGCRVTAPPVVSRRWPVAIAVMVVVIVGHEGHAATGAAAVAAVTLKGISAGVVVLIQVRSPAISNGRA